MMILKKFRRVAAPEKELRFTRSGQAVWFWLGALALVAAAVVILIAASGRLTEPERIHAAWSVIPAVFAWICARLALRLTRHAYLILTPMGLEIFPFFRPARGMQMVGWGELSDVEVDGRVHRLTLHFDVARTSGIHLTLVPIREDLRPLLVAAVMERVGGKSVESRVGVR